MARTQTAFINKVKAMLADDNLTVVKGDVFKFIDSCTRRFDLIFADPPYDLPRFADVPRLVLDSPVMGPGSIFVMEHPREHDFSALPHFMQHRAYGKVNFSIFSRPE